MLSDSIGLHAHATPSRQRYLKGLQTASEEKFVFKIRLSTHHLSVQSRFVSKWIPFLRHQGLIMISMNKHTQPLLFSHLLNRYLQRLERPLWIFTKLNPVQKCRFFDLQAQMPWRLDTKGRNLFILHRNTFLYIYISNERHFYIQCSFTSMKTSRIEWSKSSCPCPSAAQVQTKQTHLLIQYYLCSFRATCGLAPSLRAISRCPSSARVNLV